MSETKCDKCDDRAWMFGTAINEDRTKRNIALCRVHADERHEEMAARGRARTEAAGGPIKQHCPRSGEMFQHPDGGESEWRYIRDDDVLTCSYCGSIHPDEFMAQVRSGSPIGATDKSYKAYVEEMSSREPVRMDHAPKFYYQHLSSEQQDEFVRLWNERVLMSRRFDFATDEYVTVPARDYWSGVLPFFMRRGPVEGEPHE